MPAWVTFLAASGVPAGAHAQDPVVIVGPVAGKADPERDEANDKKRILPLFAAQAEQRGFRLPRTFGIGVTYVDDTTQMIGDGLALSGSVGEAEPPPDLIDFPSVSVRSIENRISSTQVQFDVFLLPFLNVFVAVGDARGQVDVKLDVDLEQVLPPLYCRLQGCGVQPIDFTLPIENRTTTLGGTLAYGGKLDAHGNEWFVAATGTRTVSISSKERSNIDSGSISMRGGVRFRLGRDRTLAPYFGVNHLRLETEVTGIERANGLLANQDRLSIRYKFRIDDEHSYSAIAGANFELNRALQFLAEYAAGPASDRFIASAKFRF